MLNQKNTRGQRALKYFAHIGSALFVAIIESFILHPLDTATKRLQVNKSEKQKLPASHSTNFISKELLLASCSKKLTQSYKIIIPAGCSLFSLYDGFYPGMAYRMAQRGLAFGLEHDVEQFIHQRLKDTPLKDKKYFSSLTHALAGGVIGLVEPAILPLDKWKIAGMLGDRISFWNFMKREKLNAYNGVGITALRNILAMSILFGGTELGKNFILRKQTIELITDKQKFSLSFLSAVGGTFLTHPLDVLKTRAQKPDGSPAWQEFLKLKKAGELKELLNGLGPRTITTALRLAGLKNSIEKLTSTLDQLIQENSEIKSIETANPQSSTKPKRRGLMMILD